jgi:hypothetical protein
MSPTRARRLAFSAILAVAAGLAPKESAADVTVFVAATTQPSNRPTFGVAAGGGLLIAGVEFEYAAAQEAADSLAPSLKTGMVSGYVQNPVPIAGLQFYAIVGAGLYRERFGQADAVTGLMTGAGGGVKMSLAGPVRLRIDYRVLLLRGDARYTSPKRFSAGLTVGF